MKLGHLYRHVWTQRLSYRVKKEKNKCHIPHRYVEPREMVLMILFAKEKQILRHREQTFGYQEGQRGSERNWELGLTYAHYWYYV